jgi:hypothetical protein
MKNGKRLLLTIPPKYDKLLLQPTKEKNVDFPIPATVTEYKPEYDPNAKILIKKGYYYNSLANAEFAEVNADDVSRTYWQKDALKETNDRTGRAFDKVKEYLVENFDEIGEEHANEIARIMGIDLTKTVDVEFIVSIKATLSIPVNKDVSDISVYDFDVEISSNENEYDIEEYDADIDSIDERY